MLCDAQSWAGMSGEMGWVGGTRVDAVEIGYSFRWGKGGRVFAGWWSGKPGCHTMVGHDKVHSGVEQG